MIYYQLVIQRAGLRTIGPPENFETTVRNVAALFEEGYRKVELRILESRAASEAEIQSVVEQAQGLLRS